MAAFRCQQHRESRISLQSGSQSIHRINSEPAAIGPRASRDSHLAGIHASSIAARNIIRCRVRLGSVAQGVDLQSVVPPDGQASRRGISDGAVGAYRNADVPVLGVAARRSIRNSKGSSALGSGRRDRIAAAVPAGIANHRSQSHSARSRHIGCDIGSSAAGDLIAAVRGVIQSVDSLSAVRAHLQAGRRGEGDAGGNPQIQSEGGSQRMPACGCEGNRNIGSLAGHRACGYRNAAAVLRAKSDVGVVLGDSAARDFPVAVSSVGRHIQSPRPAGRNSRISSRRSEDDSAVGPDIHSECARLGIAARGSEWHSESSVALQAGSQSIHRINSKGAAICPRASGDRHLPGIHPSSVTAAYGVRAVCGIVVGFYGKSAVSANLKIVRLSEGDARVGPDIHRECARSGRPAIGSESHGESSDALQAGGESIHRINGEDAAVSPRASVHSHPVGIHAGRVGASHRIGGVVRHMAQSVDLQSVNPPHRQTGRRSEDDVGVGPDIHSHRACGAMTAA